MIKVEIFSQGEEVVCGQTVDTNAAWLSRQMSDTGFMVTRHTAVGDRLEDLIKLLQEIATRAEICLCTGGLGPTVDDLTALAVSKAFALPLVFDADALLQIQAYFDHRQRPMPDSNRKQAMLPHGALRLDNHWGTAPGFALQYQNCWFAFLPGVPLEMRHMFEDTVMPQLRHRYDVKPRSLITLKTIGIGESDIQQRLQKMHLPDDVTLSFCAGVEDVQTKFVFPEHYSQQRMTEISRQAHQIIGDHVYAVNGFSKHYESIAHIIDELMAERGVSLAAVETISHGLLVAKTREFNFVKASSYISNPMDLLILKGVETKNLSLYQQAYEMLETIRCEYETDLLILQHYDISSQAIDDRNRTLAVVTLPATPDDIIEQIDTIGGHRLRKQNQAALLALDLIRKYLQQLH